MNRKIFLLISAIAVILSGCNGNGPGVEEELPISTLRYETHPVGSSDFAAHIEDNYVLVNSCKDESHWYFIYYMGYIQSVPIAYKTVYRYNGTTPINITWEKSWATEESVTQSMTESKQNSWSVTAGLTMGMEISTSGGIPLIAEIDVTTSISTSIGGEYGEIVTTANTWETTKSMIEGESESISAVIGEHGEAPGRYRYAYFGTTDVYCIVKILPSTPRQVVETKIVECARAGSFGWGIDFEPDENGHFGKTGKGKLFETPVIDISTLTEPVNVLGEGEDPDPPTTTYKDTDMLAYTGQVKGGAENRNGDNEVGSKDGHNTAWKFNIKEIKLINKRSDGTYSDLKISVSYIVEELKSDYTKLEIEKDHYVSLANRKVTELRSHPAEYGGMIGGKCHDWKRVIGPTGGALVRELSVRVDSSNTNDTNEIGYNAILFLEFIEIDE